MGKLGDLAAAISYVLFNQDQPGYRHGVPLRSDNKNFVHELKDGTTIFGSKDMEGRPGYKHGHAGSDFYRSPHSSLGSAAIGDSHDSEEHKRRTHRWE